METWTNLLSLGHLFWSPCERCIPIWLGRLEGRRLLSRWHKSAMQWPLPSGPGQEHSHMLQVKQGKYSYVKNSLQPQYWAHRLVSARTLQMWISIAVVALLHSPGDIYPQGVCWSFGILPPSDWQKGNLARAFQLFYIFIQVYLKTNFLVIFVLCLVTDTFYSFLAMNWTSFNISFNKHFTWLEMGQWTIIKAAPTGNSLNIGNIVLEHPFPLRTTQHGIFNLLKYWLNSMIRNIVLK